MNNRRISGFSRRRPCGKPFQRLLRRNLYIYFILLHFVIFFYSKHLFLSCIFLISVYIQKKRRDIYYKWEIFKEKIFKHLLKGDSNVPAAKEQKARRNIAISAGQAGPARLSGASERKRMCYENMQKVLFPVSRPCHAGCISLLHRILRIRGYGSAQVIPAVSLGRDAKDGNL